MKVKQFATVVSGATPSKKHPEYYGGDIVWFTPKDLSDSGKKYMKRGQLSLTKNGFDSCSASMIPAHSVLMSSRAPIGLLAINETECCTNQGFKSIVPNQEICLTEYLYYYLKQNIKAVESLGSGTTFKEIDKASLEDMNIELPSIAEQHAVSSVLSVLDDAIDNNNSICSDLEAAAKLLYDYWFVQFDFPDENGKPYKSSGGKMVWNDELKREIPEGWKAISLAECIAVKKSGDWGDAEQQKADDIKVSCIRGADFPAVLNEYALTAPARYIRSKKSGCLLSDGDLVTEISGGSPTQSTGRICYVNQGLLDRSTSDVTCSNFCLAFTPRDMNEQFWLYQTWKAHYDAGVMFNFESKTTGLKNLMFDDFTSSVKVPCPPSCLMRQYQLVASDFYDLVQAGLKESASLAVLRDFLLPLLMNGQVTIGDDGK